MVAIQLEAKGRCTMCHVGGDVAAMQRLSPTVNYQSGPVETFGPSGSLAAGVVAQCLPAIQDPVLYNEM